MGKLNLSLLIAASAAVLFAQYPVASGGGGVGGASNLTTVGAVPYIASAGVLTSSPDVKIFIDASTTSSDFRSPTIDMGFGAYDGGVTPYSFIQSSDLSVTTAKPIYLFSSKVVFTNGLTEDAVVEINSSGTSTFKNTTATTGSTLVQVQRGAAQNSSSNVLSVDGTVKFGGSNSTGAGAAVLGANSPASTLTAPYTWIKAVSSDGSTVYIPAWK
ncbi:MAG: hypothetical protein WCP82_07940 [Alphaproteobacteria bacterium]